MKKIIKEFRIASEIVRYNLRGALELRGSFILNVIGMMLNNTSFVLVWVFFFQAFGSIKGWSATEVLGFQGIQACAFGIAFSVMAGARTLPTAVNNGMFDNLLLSPRSVYARIITNTIGISAIGDIFFGALLMGLYIVIAKIALLPALAFVSLLIPATIIMVNVALVTSLSSFFIPDSSAFSQNIFEAFVSPGLYPSTLYPQALKLFFIFVIPSLAVAGLPVEVIQHSSWQWYCVIWGLAFFWMFLGHTLLHRAIRHYESGNIIGARV